MTANRNTTRRLATTARGCVRALALATLFAGPLAGFAVAKADEGVRSGNAVGFVLYVSLMRP